MQTWAPTARHPVPAPCDPPAYLLGRLIVRLISDASSSTCFTAQTTKAPAAAIAITAAAIGVIRS